MIVVYGVFLVLFGALILIPYLVLVSVPFVMAGAVVVGGPRVALTALREMRARRAPARVPQAGVLGVHGLEAAPALAVALDGELGRVLDLAPASSCPRACACVKPCDEGMVGVLRVFDRRGHYLLRTVGDSARSVVDRFVGELGRFADTFPAPPGAARAEIGDCDMRTCPIRHLGPEALQLGALAA